MKEWEHACPCLRPTSIWKISAFKSVIECHIYFLTTGSLPRVAPGNRSKQACWRRQGLAYPAKACQRWEMWTQRTPMLVACNSEVLFFIPGSTCPGKAVASWRPPLSSREVDNSRQSHWQVLNLLLAYITGLVALDAKPFNCAVLVHKSHFTLAAAFHL